MRWLDCIIDLMDMTLSKLPEIVKDREAWDAGVHGVTMSDMTLSDWITTMKYIAKLGIIEFCVWAIIITVKVNFLNAIYWSLFCIFYLTSVENVVLPWWLNGKASACQRRRHRFNFWSRKISWRGIATHSSILAWRILWTEEPGGLQSMGFQRVRQN